MNDEFQSQGVIEKTYKPILVNHILLIFIVFYLWWFLDGLIRWKLS